jgi:hypothetical protein
MIVMAILEGNRGDSFHFVFFLLLMFGVGLSSMMMFADRGGIGISCG